MANKSGWWRLEVSDDIELDDVDLEHIGELITEGYTSGELCDTSDSEDEED